MRYYFHVVFQNNIIYLSLQINRLYSFVKIFLIIILIIIFLIIFLIIKKREREKEIIVVYKYSVYFS